MVKKRGKLEVIYDILSLIKNSNNSIKITPLLRKSNLSSGSFNEYYSRLIERGLIREISNENGKLVSLTDKGFNYLEKYQKINLFISDFDL